eukprot:567824-Hanusia_phi.AAC.1
MKGGGYGHFVVGLKLLSLLLPYVPGGGERRRDAEERRHVTVQMPTDFRVELEPLRGDERKERKSRKHLCGLK